MKRLLRKMMSAAVGSVMLLTAVGGIQPGSVTAAGNCSVDTGKTYQTIRGFGGINLPEWITQGDMTDAQVQKAFGNGSDELGFTILRIYVSDDSNAWKTAVPTAKRAQALGATVFASPWNPPSNARNNGGGGKYSMSSQHFSNYAQHLNSYIKYMEGQGIDLYAVSVQNEPDYASEWTYWSNNDMVSFLANYGKKVTEGTNAKLMSPESFQYRKGFYNDILGNAQAFANTDLFGTHFYGTSRNDMNFQALENCGKDIWMTEVYVPNSDADSSDIWSQAIQVSENMHNGLVVGNMNAYVWWYIRRSYGPMKENGQISKRGYNMAQFSKWVRPGAVRIDATESPENNVLISAYKNTDGKIAVVAINKNNSANTETIKLAKGETITKLEAYRTSSSENIKSVSGLSYSGSSFTAQLPASSVTTFVISTDGTSSGGESSGGESSGGESGHNITAPDENGYYFHDTFESGSDDWSGRGSASVAASTKAAYAGSGSLLVTDREYEWNGATKELGSEFEPGTSYSFSATAMSDSSSETFHLTLEYKDSDGTSHYDKIASGAAAQGDWVQLANASFKIPSGATGIHLYVETDSGKNNFYLDEVIGAKDGTVIKGPKPVSYKLGDVNGDGSINAIDLALAKQGMISGKFKAAGAKKAADVDQNGAVELDDIEWFVQYLTAQVKEFPEPVAPPPGVMRSIEEYTPIVEAQVREKETSDSTQRKNGVTYPQIQKKQYFSKKANKNKNVNVMLPANYDESKKYPVLYILHGFFEDEDRMIKTGNNPPIRTPEIITNAIAAGEAEEMIVVVPFVFTSATMNDATGFADPGSNEGYDNFVDDIVDSLMPWVEQNYSAATGRENAAVTGFSMGGRESLQIGMKYGDKFGYVGAICPAPGASGNWKWSSAESTPSLVFITGGTQDDVVRLDTPQGYHDNFERNGVPHIWHIVNGGHHGDDSILAHIYNFVRAVFKA